MNNALTLIFNRHTECSATTLGIFKLSHLPRQSAKLLYHQLESGLEGRALCIYNDFRCWFRKCAFNGWGCDIIQKTRLKKNKTVTYTIVNWTEIRCMCISLNLSFLLRERNDIFWRLQQWDAMRRLREHPRGRIWLH